MSAVAAELARNCNRIPYVYIFLQYMGEKVFPSMPKQQYQRVLQKVHFVCARSKQFWSLTYKSVFHHIRGSPSQSGIVLEGGLCQTVSVLYMGEDDVITLSRTLVLVALGEYLENNSRFHFGLVAV